MKLLWLSLFSIVAAPHLLAITTQEELIATARNSDSIVCIRITASPKPRVDIISVWKPDDSISNELSIRQSVNTFITDHPYLNPPAYDVAFLLMSKNPKGDFNGLPTSFVRVTSVDIQNHCLLLGGHEIPLEDAKRLIKDSLLKAKQGAAANP